MLKTLLIGLGKIACGYDKKSDNIIRTHLKGYLNNNNFQVCCVLDNDIKKAKEVSKYWDIKSYHDNIENLKGKRIDIISICTPDDTHSFYLRKCLKLNPKAVFCEKPLSLKISDAKEIIAEYNKKNILLAINYSRRWITEICKLKERINKNNFGRIISARLKYYDGFLHNGSHLFDLLIYLLRPGLIHSIKTNRKKSNNLHDTNFSAMCNFASNSGNFTLMVEGYQESIVTPLELELIFDRVKIIIEEKNGTQILYSYLKENTIYPGYYEFSNVKKVEIDSSSAMVNAIQNIAEAVLNGKYLLSDGDSAFRTLKLCFQIYKSPEIKLWQS